MKKIYFALLTAFAALAMTSCQKEETVDPFSDRISACEAAIAPLLEQITSMKVVPNCSDGSVCLWNSEDEDGCSFKFEVYPAEIIKKIVDTVNASGDTTVFSILDSGGKYANKIKSVSIDDEGLLVISTKYRLGATGYGIVTMQIKAGSIDRKTPPFVVRCSPDSRETMRIFADGLYQILREMGQDPLHAPWFITNLMSDDCLGGGTADHFEGVAISQLMVTGSDYYLDTWNHIFDGIACANKLISVIDGVRWTGYEGDRNQILGEAYFMRGLFSFWGTQLWGDIPAYWDETSRPDTIRQQRAEDVIYPHILSDFVSGINLMSVIDKSKPCNKFVAEAMLARAYMFWAGFYKKVDELAKGSAPAIELVEQEGCEKPSLLQAEVIEYLKDVIANGGYYLVTDFRGLWPYSNTYLYDESRAESGPNYFFIKDMKPEDCYDKGTRKAEEIFSIQFDPSTSFKFGQCSNMTSYYTSLCPGNGAGGNCNGKVNTYPFAQGLGIGTVNPGLWKDWTDAETGGGYADIRKIGSIASRETDGEFNDSLVLSASAIEESGCYNKKWMENTLKYSSFDDFGGSYTWWGAARDEYGMAVPDMGNSVRYDHFSEIYLIRYDDVLLMASELTGDAQYINQVQARGGVPQTAYSLTEVQNQRRWEFAGEGMRFNDLRRWSGKEGGEFCLAATALQKQNGVDIFSNGAWKKLSHTSSSWAARYASTDGFLPIPQSVIDEVGDETLLKQNPGWGSGDSWQMNSAPVY